MRTLILIIACLTISPSLFSSEAEKSIKEEVTSQEITIKIRGERRFIEVCKITQIKEAATNKIIAINKHRSSMDVSVKDEDGNDRSPEIVNTEKEKVISSIGADLAAKALAVELTNK